MKRKPLLMKTKLEILDEYKKGSKLSDIARRRGLNASTVHYIINQVNFITEMTHKLWIAWLRLKSFFRSHKGQKVIWGHFSHSCHGRV